MLELKINPNELREYAKTLPNIKEKIFDLIRMDVREVARDFVNGLMSAEFELFIGREKHQRQSILSIADRKGIYKTNILEKYQRTETSLKEDVAILYLMGVSTRSLAYF